MIGLKNDVVQIVPYDSEWNNLFKIEKNTQSSHRGC
jgi:GrpB-like predicted nucleotidyltransferase (UPF0157 family)